MEQFLRSLESCQSWTYKPQDAFWCIYFMKETHFWEMAESTSSLDIILAIWTIVFPGIYRYHSSIEGLFHKNPDYNSHHHFCLEISPSIDSAHNDLWSIEWDSSPSICLSSTPHPRFCGFVLGYQTHIHHAAEVTFNMAGEPTQCPGEDLRLGGTDQTLWRIDELHLQYTRSCMYSRSRIKWWS